MATRTSSRTAAATAVSSASSASSSSSSSSSAAGATRRTKGKKQQAQQNHEDDMDVDGGSQQPSNGNNKKQQRFTELLQPIKDLATNWDIDIANDLEEYLSEVAKITYFFDNQRHSLNFAEAALLIQNSASVYSRKVEYLYNLVHQTLELISSKKPSKLQSSLDADGRDQDVSQLDDEDEFLALNDIEESKGIDLVENHPPNYHYNNNNNSRHSNYHHGGGGGGGNHKSQSEGGAGPTLPQTPTAFQPNLDRGVGGIELISTRGDVVGKRDDFKMNTSTVHISGALLLDVSDFFGVDKNLQPVDETTRQQQKSAQSLVVTPSTALADQILRSGFEPLSDLRGSSESIQPLQDAGAAAGSSAAGDAPPHQEEPFYDYGGNPEDYGGGGGGNDDYSDDGGAGAADDIDNSDGRFSLEPNHRRAQKANDPWKMLDPHDTGAASALKPFRKGKPYKIPQTTDDAAGNGKKKAAAAAASTTSVDLAQVLKDLHAAQKHQRSLPKNPLKAPSFPEFDYIFFKEQARRTAIVAASKRRNTMLSHHSNWDASGAPFMAGDDSDEEFHDYGGGPDDYDVDDDNANTQGGDQLALGEVPFGGQEYHYDEDPRPHHQQSDLDAFPALQQQPQHQHSLQPVDEIVVSNGSYEDLCHQKIEAYLATAQKYEEQLETSLSKRVREWEEKLQPLLAQQEKRPFFDVHKYGAHVIESFHDRKLKEGDTITLADVASETTDKYEVIRLFMATLHLANNDNIEIGAYKNQMNITLKNTSIHDLAVA